MVHTSVRTSPGGLGMLSNTSHRPACKTNTNRGFAMIPPSTCGAELRTGGRTKRKALSGSNVLVHFLGGRGDFLIGTFEIGDLQGQKITGGPELPKMSKRWWVQGLVELQQTTCKP